MEAHNVYVDSIQQGIISPALAAETVILTLPPGVTTPVGTLIVIEAVYAVQVGTGTTSVAIRLRRGTTVAGALLGQPTAVTTVAGQTYTLPHQAADTPGEVAGQQYVLTAQQGAATGNGITTFASIQATWIS